MLKKIESIRKKPKEVREKYAFWSALGFTMIIVLFWLMSVPSRFDFVVTESAQEKNKGGFARSFSDFKVSVSQGIDSIKKNTEVSSDEGLINVSSDSEINFDSILTAPPVQQKEPQQSAKEVLIGTSSASIASSTAF